jgi:hypothetical protein
MTADTGQERTFLALRQLQHSTAVIDLGREPPRSAEGVVELHAVTVMASANSNRTDAMAPRLSKRHTIPSDKPWH